MASLQELAAKLRDKFTVPEIGTNRGIADDINFPTRNAEVVATLYIDGGSGDQVFSFVQHPVILTTEGPRALKDPLAVLELIRRGDGETVSITSLYGKDNNRRPVPVNEELATKLIGQYVKEWDNRNKLKELPEPSSVMSLPLLRE